MCTFSKLRSTVAWLKFQNFPNPELSKDWSFESSGFLKFSTFTLAFMINTKFSYAGSFYPAGTELCHSIGPNFSASYVEISKQISIKLQLFS